MLRRTGFVSLPPGAAPGFDHADVYTPTRRLYVAHTGADRVEVIDCVEQRHVGSLEGLPGVAGVLVDEAGDLLFTSDRACARVSVFRASDGQLVGRVEVGAHPNGLAYDRNDGRLFCAADGGELVVVDCDTGAVRGILALPGAPDVVMHDAGLRRLYVAIGDRGVVSSFETAEEPRHLADTITEPGAHTLGLDPISHHVYVFCPESGGAIVYAVA
jgi:DNA-binding beta-propeller fold protein YncE